MLIENIYLVCHTICVENRKKNAYKMVVLTSMSRKIALIGQDMLTLLHNLVLLSVFPLGTNKCSYYYTIYFNNRQIELLRRKVLKRLTEDVHMHMVSHLFTHLIDKFNIVIYLSTIDTYIITLEGNFIFVE